MLTHKHKNPRQWWQFWRKWWDVYEFYCFNEFTKEDKAILSRYKNDVEFSRALPYEILASGIKITARHAVAIIKFKDSFGRWPSLREVDLNWERWK